MFPVTTFDHMGELFTPNVAVPLDHYLIGLRPDLFTATPPNKPARATTTKE